MGCFQFGKEKRAPYIFFLGASDFYIWFRYNFSVLGSIGDFTDTSFLLTAFLFPFVYKPLWL